MPIVARQPGSDPPTGSRSGDDAPAGRPAAPEDLLPSGVAPAVAPALAPHRALALDALRVLDILRDLPRGAGPSGGPAFAREVDAVRGQLAPIRDRRGLAASYGREAFRMRDALALAAQHPASPAGGAALRPSRVAYALRWLELGDGLARPTWTSLVTDRA
jgi:hypothetical protein